MHATKFISVIIGLAAFGAATERGFAKEADAAFNGLDADQSGAITWAEAYRVRTGQFMDMDADMDGILTVDEFQGPVRPLSAFDTDEDERLHLAEFLAGHRNMFDRFDKDANGSLTFDEFEAAQSAARGN
ncbi:EF-hand domain-containing protein [Lutimaribacter sp. EGI FJ00015]|uniref:EF-hand domain-containing protein n=1 Tax=Lutimaribacter degradans TaxID=2945989 RepID=A0ACC5ZWH4_9RHOB|nr:EF-hand domain-containing protein [Lutimaribacter sp. EGI FJ00013]MCM2562308.1 EF-hand domain-containing protein [Lutimaribacter sp. EGI FJ00013]MCO0613463.1 EF-hand domain-containing protein [Lutimaribacter sp. EGI FJ00015]MCO0636437.1 EF-hand domain-containing protein [Lutimaribacter sp. EGI FJ00014]